jgi:hypothetical protein
VGRRPLREFFPEHLRIAQKDGAINGVGLFAHGFVWLIAIWFLNLLSM